MAARTAARTLARGLIVRGKSSNATHVVGEAVAGASEAAAPTSAIQAAREAISSYAKKHPVIFGSMITVVKTSVADIMAQKLIEKREDIDWRRNAGFCTFGFLYLSLGQYWLYNKLFHRLCAPLKARYGYGVTVAAKVFLDQAIHHPFVYFPVFYSIKAAVEGRDWEWVWSKYTTEFRESVKQLWMIWVPCQIVNFAVVPMHYRIPFVAAVSFVWTTVLSVMQGSFDAKRKEELGEE
mmetsp:Transcript_3130/g.11145  ORF Transcript_3130/g.11145 Transcript_3130/m.11145 type:complete len:237 (+) Transcript_3130:106-816(+)